MEAWKKGKGEGTSALRGAGHALSPARKGRMGESTFCGRRIIRSSPEFFDLAGLLDLSRTRPRRQSRGESSSDSARL